MADEFWDDFLTENESEVVNEPVEQAERAEQAEPRMGRLSGVEADDEATDSEQSQPKPIVPELALFDGLSKSADNHAERNEARDNAHPDREILAAVDGDESAESESEERGEESKGLEQNDSSGDDSKTHPLDVQAIEFVEQRRAANKARGLKINETDPMIEQVYRTIYDLGDENLSEDEKELAAIQIELVRGVFNFTVNTMREAEKLHLLFDSCLSKLSEEDITREFAKYFIEQQVQARRLVSAAKRRISFKIPQSMPSLESIERIPDDEPISWKKRPVVDLDTVTPVVEQALHAQEIYRCGQLYHLIVYIEQNPNDYTWPKSIGKIKARSITNELKSMIKEYEHIPPGGRQKQSDLDILTGNVKRLRAASDYSFSEDQSVWSAGLQWFNKGGDIMECPYRPGVRQADWIRGFLFAEHREESKRTSYSNAIPGKA